MHQETSLIVNAIESLNHEHSIFKEYLFPIFSAFFTSLLGAGIAYFFFRYQEDIKIEKEKIDVTNKWILHAEEAMQNLIMFKNNYHGKLKSSPIQRAMAMPNIIFTASSITEDYSKLSFLTRETLKGKYLKWSQVPRIRAMFHNYNYVQELFNTLNETNQPIKEKILILTSNKAFIDVSEDDILKSIDHASLATVIAINELIINLIDDLLIEFEDFMTNFPIYAKTLINTKRLQKYGAILTYTNEDNKMRKTLLEQSPKADYKSVVDLFGKTEEELKQQFSTGY